MGLIRPHFSVTQDADHVVVVIRIPYVRVGDAEIVVDGAELSFFCAPYLLKLTFPRNLRDEEHARAEYDSSVAHGTITLRLAKAVPGEAFPDLDLPTRLVSPDPVFPSRRVGPRADGEEGESDPEARMLSQLRGMTLAQEEEGLPARRPLIEVLSSSEAEGGTACDEAQGGVGVPVVDAAREYGYGFNRRHRGMFSALRDTAASVVALPDPEAVLAVDRPVLRTLAEDAAFDPARYAGDWVAGAEDIMYQEAVDLKPWWLHWAVAVAEARGSGGPDPAWTWTEAEHASLSSLPNREFLVDGAIVGGSAAPARDQGERPRPERARLLAALAGMLAAYAYDHRTTGGERSVESGWTCATLSPALSWLDDELCPPTGEGAGGLWGQLAAVFMRRVLTFPYLRRWDLSELCMQDGAMLLALGVRPVLRALLSMQDVFAHDTDDKSGAPRYLLNTLWLDEMIGWLQAAGPGAPTDAVLADAAAEFSAAVREVTPDSPALREWGLRELEAEAEEAEAVEGEEQANGDMGEEEEEECEEGKEPA
jgi:protein SHQ1